MQVRLGRILKTLIASFWPEAGCGKLEDDRFRLWSSVFGLPSSDKTGYFSKNEFHS